MRSNKPTGLRIRNYASIMAGILLGLVFMLGNPWVATAGLVMCPDCSNYVSDAAISCPKCGRPMNAKPAATPPATAPAPAALSVTGPGAAFNQVRDAMVLIQTKEGSGSGFVTEMDGKRFILTNAHVVDRCEGLVFRSITGERLSCTNIEFANNKDLVRMPLENAGQHLRPLTLAKEASTVGEEVSVYGNSQGSDVITELKGRVLGVGPDKIEVDAAFVQGNSGSPIVNAKGEVIGVATYVTKTSTATDWVVSNTRFAETRRFGTIPSNTRWVNVDVQKLRKQLSTLKNVEALMTDLATLIGNWRTDAGSRSEAQAMLRNYSASSSEGSYTNTGWPQAIEKFCSSYVTLAMNDMKMPMQLQGTEKITKGSSKYKHLVEYRDKTMTNLCHQATVVLQRSTWSTDFMKSDATQYEEWLKMLNTYYQQAEASDQWGRLMTMGGMSSSQSPRQGGQGGQNGRPPMRR